MFKQIEAWLAKYDGDSKPLSKRERDLITKWQADPNTDDKFKTVTKLAGAISMMRVK